MFIQFFKKFNKFNIRHISGFTLVELMVATTIFTIVMLMGVGSLVVSSNSAKASHRLRVAVDNVNFAVESMTRELRTGTNYYCAQNDYLMGNNTEKQDCSNGGNIIAFNTQNYPIDSYRAAYYKVARKVDNHPDGTYTIERCEYPPVGSKKCSDIVSSDVDIRQLTFYVKGSSLSTGIPHDNTQPSVRILIKGVVKSNGIETPFFIQTMASQRSAEK